MTKYESSLVIPKLDQQNRIRYSDEGFAELPSQANGERALKSMLEHDAHYLPIGKVVDAAVQDLGKEILLTTVIDETHSLHHFKHSATGEAMIEMTFTNDTRPFVLHPFSDETPGLQASVDRVNFENWDECAQFMTEAKDPALHADSIRLGVRRSLTPEPVIQFLLDYPELALLFGWVLKRGEKFLRYTIDKTLRKTGDDISDALSKRIRRVIKKYDNLRAPDDRCSTSHIVIRADPEINLLTKSENTKDNTDIGLSSLCQQLETYKDVLGTADSITFARSNKDDEWQLLYIETKSGHVIATTDCYEKTSKDLNILRGAAPICLCLKHRVTGAERHYKTSAKFKKIDEAEDSEHYGMTIHPIPPDFEEWEVTSIVLEKGNSY